MNTNRDIDIVSDDWGAEVLSELSWVPVEDIMIQAEMRVNRW